MLRNEIIRAISNGADYQAYTNKDGLYVEGYAENMADEILKVLNKE